MTRDSRFGQLSRNINKYSQDPKIMFLILKMERLRNLGSGFDFESIQKSYKDRMHVTNFHIQMKKKRKKTLKVRENQDRLVYLKNIKRESQISDTRDHDKESRKACTIMNQIIKIQLNKGAQIIYNDAL